MTGAEKHCHSCGGHLRSLSCEDAFKAVSSDIQIVDGEIHLAVCDACGLLQKHVDPAWQAAVDAIYGDYRINHQSGGADPYIFNSLYGAGPRADILGRHLQQECALPEQGRLLDIGCGNGNILRSFAAQYPGWQLAGVDGSGRWRDTLLAIPGVTQFHASLEALGEQQFDLIIMSHVLEHIPDPVTYLRRLRQYLAPGGMLFIAVPDIRQNPIDLFVLDHCTHFDEVTLSQVFAAAGCAVHSLRSDVLGRELVLLSRPDQPAAYQPGRFAMPLVHMAERYLGLCHDLLLHARSLRATHASLAILGTSTAAAWLAAGLAMQVDFYVDEDPQRVGKTAFGQPILSLADIPPGACVLIPMASDTARRIIERARRPDVTFSYLAWNDVSDAAARAV